MQDVLTPEVLPAQTEEIAPLSFMEQIRTDFAQEETFEITLSNGLTLKVKTPKREADVEVLEKKGRELYKFIEKGESVPAAWKPFLPITRSTARKIAFVSGLTVDPKLSQLNCLELAKDFGGVFLALYSAIMEKMTLGIALTETEEWDETGEGSGEMSSGVTTSP